MAEKTKAADWLAALVFYVAPLLAGGRPSVRRLSSDTEYFDAIGINAGDPLSAAKIQKALESAHRLRSFEIEMYWKRATYAWAFQAIAFGGVALAFKDKPELPLVAAFSAIGTVAAIAAYLTALGSKFWQENWEGHVQRLGAHHEGYLTDVVLSRNGSSSFSVSRINENFLLWLGVAWICIFAVSGLKICFPSSSAAKIISTPAGQFSSCAALMIVAVVLMVFRGRSRLKDKIHLSLNPKIRPGAAGR